MNKQNTITLLNDEQEKVISSNSKKILVLAGPGSGKTYTIVERVRRRIASDTKNILKSIIVCSFSNNSVADLKSKFESCGVSNEKIYIVTLDSLVYNIINSFKNRWLVKQKRSIIANNLTKIIPDKQEYNLSKKMNKESEENEWRKWLDEFSHGNYIISFPTYLTAEKMIKDMNILQSYLSSKYDSIYIDEVQDLNLYQHKFIETLYNLCSLSIFMVGDTNQRLYEWRGAREELMLNLKNYERFYINQNIRSNENIIYFANEFLGRGNIVIRKNEERVRTINDINFELLNNANLKGNYLILCDTQSGIIEAYNKIKNQIDHKLILIKDIDFKKSPELKEVIEKILYFYYNFRNKIPKYVYEFSKYEEYLSLYNSNKNFKKNEIEILKKINIDPCVYLKNVGLILNIEFDKDLLKNISINLSYEEYINKYIRDDDQNKIMTIHASKGLEAESVFVYNQDIDPSNQGYKWDNKKLTKQDKWKYYVAFTRSREYLYIKTKDESILKIINEYKDKLRIDNNL